MKEFEKIQSCDCIKIGDGVVMINKGTVMKSTPWNEELSLGVGRTDLYQCPNCKNVKLVLVK